MGAITKLLAAIAPLRAPSAAPAADAAAATAGNASAAVDVAQAARASAPITAAPAPGPVPAPPKPYQSRAPIGALPTLGLASNAAEVRGALRLVHDEYVRAGIFSAPRPSGLHAPEQVIGGSPYVVVHRAGPKVVGTITLVPGATGGLPVERVAPFAKIVADLRAVPGNKVMEVGLFARDATVTAEAASQIESGHRVTMGLFGAARALALRDGATHFAITVHPRHARFYERLGFKPFGEEANHPTVDGARAVLLVLKLDEMPPVVVRALEAAAPKFDSVPSASERSKLALTAAGHAGRAAQLEQSTAATAVLATGPTASAALALHEQGVVPLVDERELAAMGSLSFGEIAMEHARGAADAAKALGVLVTENPGTALLVVGASLALTAAVPLVATCAAVALTAVSAWELLEHEVAAATAATTEQSRAELRGAGAAAVGTALGALPGLQRIGRLAKP